MKRCAALLILVACGTKSEPKQQEKAAPVPAGDPTPPQLRLPSTVRPIRNVVDLTIDPATEVFSGSIAIDVDVTAPLDVLWLNQLELEIDDAKIDDIALRPVLSNHYAGLVPAKKIAAGKHTVRIKYRGKMTKNDGDGIYTAQESGDWYAFTQFEATDARRAFPCFDEPSFKVPWQLTIRAPKDLVTLSNTPAESEKVEGALKITKFAETPPLPSYLVAFAVGPFEFVDAGKTRSGVPMRIVVPHGRAADAAYPAEVTRRSSRRSRTTSARRIRSRSSIRSRCRCSTRARWRTRGSSRTARRSC
jgi:aminopeptidase N